MKLVNSLEQCAPKLTMMLSLGCIIGLFALMTLPSGNALQTLISPPAPIIDKQKTELVIFANWPKSSAAASYNNSKSVSHYQFSQDDLVRYNNIYDLQEKSSWEQADAEISNLNDDSLLADILAERYLHSSYSSSYGELKTWLHKYADHPDASRISRLAKRKSPAGAELPTVRSVKSLRLNYGVRDGIGGRSMPNGWRHALRLWQGKHYSDAYAKFSAIAGRSGLNKWQSSTAHYWAYRASIYTHQRELAEYHLRESAMSPFTFYGAMAAVQLTPSLYKPRYSKVSREISSLPATRRAAAFVALDNKHKAKRELLHIYGQISPTKRHELVSLAAAFNLPALQLRLSQMQHRDPQVSDATAYPVPDWMPNYDMQVDPAFVYAIIRQESAFNTRAQSSAGARGAMQLMPKTANYVIKTRKLNELQLASLDMTAYQPPITREDLYKPGVNLLIGQNYIQYLSEKSYINGNLVYLLAAYNAGPGNLLDWQKRFGHIRDPLLFIEHIPFKETRHYIKQVMANYIVYQAMMYGQSYSIPALQAGNWPVLPARGTYAALHDRQFASR